MTPPHHPHWERFRDDPDDRAAFEMLEEHLFMEGDWTALAELYRRRQGAPSLAERPRARGELAMRLGQLCEDRLSDPESAIRAYTEAVRLDPTLRRALRNLRRIYAGRRSWEAVLQVGEQEASLAESGEERARIFAEMGDIWLRELGDRDHAEELYARARNESRAGAEPADASAGEADPARVQDAWLAAARGDTVAAIATLERALALDPADVEALDMMLTVLEGAERHAEMCPLLERRAALASDAETRGAVLQRLGEIQELRGEVEDARDSYERALAARPGDSGARAALVRIYRSTESWSPLRSLLENAAESADDAARVDLLYELAGVAAEGLDDPDAARDFIEQALALAPDDPRLQTAQGQLEEEQVALTMPEWDTELDVGEQRSSRVVGILERKLAAREAQGAGASRATTALRLRIAELRSGPLGDPAEAIGALEPATADPESLREVAPMLAGLYEQLGRIEPLIDLAERAAEGCEESSSRLFWLRRAADAARAAGEPERAIRCLRRLLEGAPQDRGARRDLVELYRSRGDTEPLVALLREELRVAGEEREAELHRELAALLTDASDDAPGAIAHLRRCLELEPGRDDLLENALAACSRRGGPLAQLDLLDHVADTTRDVAVRAAYLARRGALLADALDWGDEAVESWREALSLDPQQSLARERLGAVGA